MNKVGPAKSQVCRGIKKKGTISPAICIKQEKKKKMKEIVGQLYNGN